MSITLTVIFALLLDAWLGEPRRFHPLVGFGKLANYIEQKFYANTWLSGCVSLLILVAPFVMFAVLITLTPWHFIIDIVLLYLSIGWNSLGAHARLVRNALLANDLKTARQKVGMMVSRDTTKMDRIGVTQGAIESVLENGNDAIFGVIFWFIVAGAPGAIAYRLINTLDAMWGYRNVRYCQFGWAAARLDDCLNFIPARLTALSYALVGKMRNAFNCWRTQGAAWKSPNAGPVMAAGAGSLNISLGGPAFYHGQLESRPILGNGFTPDTHHIDDALRLITRSLILWLVVLSLGECFVQYIFSD